MSVCIKVIFQYLLSLQRLEILNFPANLQWLFDGSNGFIFYRNRRKCEICQKKNSRKRKQYSTLRQCEPKLTETREFLLSIKGT